MEEYLKALQFRSSTREKILEHRFLGEVLSEFWKRRWFEFGVARGEVDDGGYDVLIEKGSISRHIQLKAKYDGGKTARYSINAALADRPSGCVVIIVHDPVTLDLIGFHYFGGVPGEPLPDLGSAEVRHTKGDSFGEKAVRPAHRQLNLGQFAKIKDVPALVDILFE